MCRSYARIPGMPSPPEGPDTQLCMVHMHCSACNIEHIASAIASLSVGWMASANGDWWCLETPDARSRFSAGVLVSHLPCERGSKKPSCVGMTLQPHSACGWVIACIRGKIDINNRSELDCSLIRRERNLWKRPSPTSSYAREHRREHRMQLLAKSRLRSACRQQAMMYTCTAIRASAATRVRLRRSVCVRERRS
jgi:hypothetical protein